MDITCSKCPAIKGKTWCTHWNCEIWCEDKMCRIGYDLRIERALKKAEQLVDENGGFVFEDPKVQKIMNQLEELDDEFSKNKPIKSKPDGHG